METFMENIMTARKQLSWKMFPFLAARGKPDQYVIESWTGQPKTVVPDSEHYTFTNSARDFVRLIEPENGRLK